MYFPQSFIKSENIPLWIPKKVQKHFEYSDETEDEQYLLECIRTTDDLSNQSSELVSQVRAWSSEYHFSLRRSNLLRPLKLNKNHSILELGAGCGAITRYLGETCKSVVAIEGKLSRATIAANRCRDLDNVNVLCNDFFDVQMEQKFDIVTLIGVLEHSQTFAKHHSNPYEATIKIAQSFLSPNGILIIAIENKLGLKYFSGCVEDHTGLLYKGLEGYDPHSQVKTFGKYELQQLLKKAGFASQEFLYPFPDYKIPSCVLRLDHYDSSQKPFFYQWLDFGNCIEHTYKRTHFFQEYLVAKELEKNFLLADFANSFLIVSSANQTNIEKLFEKEWLAKKYSVLRKKKYTTEVCLSLENDHFFIKRSLLYPQQSCVEESKKLIQHQLVENQEFIEGTLLIEDLIRELKTKGKNLTLILGDWYHFLNQNLNENGKLDGKYFDCSPWNLMRDSQGNIHFFDQEWCCVKDIDPNFVIVRCLIGLYSSLEDLIQKYLEFQGCQQTCSHFIKHCFQSLKIPPLSNRQILDLLDQEFNIQKEIHHGEVLDKKDFMGLFFPEYDSLQKQHSKIDNIFSKMKNKIFKKIKSWREIPNKNKIDFIFKDICSIAYHKTRNLTLPIVTKGVIVLDQIIFKNQWGIPISREWGYQQWLLQYYPKMGDLNTMKVRQNEFQYRPKISIIVPVYNTPKDFLTKMLDSVLNQVYTNWELCIADDCSNQPHVKKILEEYIKRDQRIKVVYRAENGHISAASNSAIEIATGEFISLLDHDDAITLHALYKVVELLNQFPEADMIYSDEDKIDENDIISHPFFKPDWSPDYFLSTMYTCHLGTYRKSLVDKIGGFRIGYEGSQDYDLVLRLTEETDKIFHIPDILYHWRMHENSTALNSNSKLYAYEIALKVVDDALKRRNELATVHHVQNYLGDYRVRYIIREYKLVSIIIPTRDRSEMLSNCLKSIFNKSFYPNFEVIILDNGSKEKATHDLFEKWKRQEKNRFKVVSLDEPFNYSAVNNHAVRYADGKYLLFLNNDIEVISSDWIDAMVEQAQRPSIGAVGGLLLYADDTIQHAGVVVGLGGTAAHSHRGLNKNDAGYFGRVVCISNCSAVTGACLMCRKEVFEEVGGFEEKLAVNYNDVDLCLKMLEKGYRNVYLPHVQLYHYESQTRKTVGDSHQQEKDFLIKKWGQYVENDPYYNPNLRKDNEHFLYHKAPHISLAKKIYNWFYLRKGSTLLEYLNDFCFAIKKRI